MNLEATEAGKTFPPVLFFIIDPVVRGCRISMRMFQTVVDNGMQVVYVNDIPLHEPERCPRKASQRADFAQEPLTAIL